MNATIEEMTARMQSLVPELGHLVAAASYKRELVERFGLDAALEAARTHLSVPGVDRMVQRSVVSLQQTAARARDYRQLWAGGRRFENTPPRVLGEGDHDIQHGVSRTAYLTCLDDVSLRGRSPVLLQHDQVLVDHEHDELSRFRDSPEVDPGVLYAEGNTYWTMEPDRYESIDEAFMLSGHWTHDFGHWLTDHLPKLGIALLAGLPDVPVLVDQRMPRTHFESLRLILPGADIMTLPHFAPIRVGRLWVSSLPRYGGYYPHDWAEAWPGIVPDPRYFATALGAVKTRLENLAANGPERVYLARRPNRKKRLTNYRAIEEIARSRDFHVVYPEDLSFADQVGLVRSARYIVAPDGSNGLLSYFSEPGTRVCFLNNIHTYPLVELNGLLSAFGVDFTVITGRTVGPELDEPFWNDYEIDARRFSAFLDGWLA